MANGKKRKKVSPRVTAGAGRRPETSRRAAVRPKGRSRESLAHRFRELDAPELARKDVWLSIAIGALAAVLFATTFSPNVAAGDPPEYVSGVHELGILHAPGYPSYVLSARAFASVVPVGSFTFRVLLFSLGCAALAVAGVFLIARCSRASRAGAAVGALSVAAATSFWYDAATAKHYAFSAFLVVAATLMILLWEAGGRRWLLVGAAIALGVCVGATWQLALIAVVSGGALMVKGSRRPSRAMVVVSLMAMGVVAFGFYAFVLVRARQDPAVNWGRATNLSRLVELVSQRDFAGTYTASSVSNPVARIGLRVVSYPILLLRDLGPGALALAVAGIAGAWWCCARGHRWFLAALSTLNLVAVAAVVPIDRVIGFRMTIFAGGYLVAFMIVVAVLVAIGFTLAIRVTIELLAQRRPQFASRRWVVPALAGVLSVLVLTPSVVFHHAPANHRIPAFADDYGRRVLEKLPPNSVLVSYRSDWEFAITYRQLVKGQRRDVSTFNISSFGVRWYREQIAQRLGVKVPISGKPLDRAITVIQELRRSRPVFLEPGAMEILQEHIGYRLRGLVAPVTSGTGPQAVTDLARASAELQAIDRADGVTGHGHLGFLNDGMLFLRSRGHVELAKAYVLAHDLAGAIAELQRAVDIYPSDVPANKVLLFMQQRRPGAERVLLHI
jgi:hypothetical protein